ncbi:MAG: right-handed parallel beta-helix repeat-containing protein [bacterium]
MKKNLLLIKRLVLIVALTAAMVAIFVFAEFAQRTYFYSIDEKFPGYHKTAPASHMMDNAMYMLGRPFRDDALKRLGMPVLELRIRPKDYARLKQTIEAVLEKGSSSGIPREYVPAKFLMDGRWIDVDVKLRGLIPNHYMREHPSLRIKFTDNQYYNRKKMINLIDPYDKALTGDATTNLEMARHGILTLESRFVGLKINGRPMGIFQEFEQFGVSITDRNRRSEGVILSVFGQTFDASGDIMPGAKKGLNQFYYCTYKAPYPPNPEICNWAYIQKYFDVDKMAWASAMTTLLGSFHAWIGENLRLYYDPARERFEPIPWDYYSYKLETDSFPEGEKAAYTGLLWMLKIPEFRRARDKRLWMLISERVEPIAENAGKLFAFLESAFSSGSSIIKKNSSSPFWDPQPHLRYVDDLTSNAGILRRMFEENNVVSAWSCENGMLKIAFNNNGKSFAEVHGIAVAHGGESFSYNVVPPQIVDGLWYGEAGYLGIAINLKKNSRFTGGCDIDVKKISMTNGVTGAAMADKEIKIERSAVPIEIAENSSGNKPPAIPIPPGMSIKGGVLHIGPGQVEIRETLIIPQSINVILTPGLRLIFSPGSSLVIFGDLTGKGTAQNPIILEGSGKSLLWGGLKVHGVRTAPRRALLEHVFFYGGSAGKDESARFTGVLTVIDSAVTIKNCHFYSGQSDDGVNIKYSSVNISDNTFENASDDSLDCDFCRGTISGNEILKSGGDAMDLSGSDLIVNNNIISECVDKGMSVGENSDIKASGNIISDCRYGIAVKDSSKAVVSDSYIFRVNAAFAAYRKKPTFGYPVFKIVSSAISDADTIYLKDPYSKIVFVDTCRYALKGKKAVETAGVRNVYSDSFSRTGAISNMKRLKGCGMRSQ